MKYDLKVIAGISYKGGQGRTMALANMGSCLYRLGYNVVLLDLDLDAQGLPYKFELSPLEGQRFKGKGIIKYLLDSVENEEAKENIDDYCIKIASSPNDGKPKSISLIPTGYIGEYDNYLQSQSSSNWLYLLDTSHTDKKIKYFQGVLKSISMLEPKPDYLLVDTKAGINDISAISMIFWAESILCFFDNDPENLESTRHILKNIDRLPDKIKKLGLEQRPIKILPILSRIPHFLSDKSREDRLKHVVDKLEIRKLRNSYDNIFMLHSDLDLGLGKYLIIPLEGEIKNTQLLNEYLELLVTIDPSIVAKKERKRTNIDYLWKELSLTGDPGEIEETYRVFRLENSQGVMINLSDDERNVSFKVETFCSMLTDIHEGLLEKSKELGWLNQEKNEKEIEKGFYGAGLACGENFGKSLVDKLWIKSKELTIKEKIHDWCEFDSSVGFGHLSEDNLETNREGKICSGKIAVKENFLAAGRCKEEANLCSLLEGYITGVLSQIFSSEVEVDHPDSECMRLTEGREYCNFNFSIKELS